MTAPLARLCPRLGRICASSPSSPSRFVYFALNKILLRTNCRSRRRIPRFFRRPSPRRRSQPSAAVHLNSFFFVSIRSMHCCGLFVGVLGCSVVWRRERTSNWRPLSASRSGEERIQGPRLEHTLRVTVALTSARSAVPPTRAGRDRSKVLLFDFAARPSRHRRQTKRAERSGVSKQISCR